MSPENSKPLSKEEFLALHPIDQETLANSGLPQNKFSAKNELLKGFEKGLSPGFGTLLPALSEGYNAYVGGPVREGFTELAKTGSPRAAIEKAKSKFGDVKQISGEEQAKSLGFSSDPASKKNPLIDPGSMLDVSPAQVAGQALEAVQDPSILVEGAVRGAGAVLGPAYKYGIKPAIKAVSETEAGGKLIEALGPAISKAKEKFVEPIISALASGAKATTGLPKEETATYIRNTPEVNSLIEKFGNDAASMVSESKKRLLGAIQSEKNQANYAIDQVLNVLPQEKAYSTDHILGMLYQKAEELNPHTKADAISQINDVIDKIHKISPDGTASIRDLHDIKELLYERGKSAYASGGQLFTNAKDSAKISKDVAVEVADLLNKSAPATYAKENKVLSELHNIEDNVVSSIFDPNAGESSFLNFKNKEMSEKIKKITGYDIQKEKELIRSARTFADVGPNVLEPTGKGVERLLKGAVLGEAAGQAAGITGHGGIIGAATSTIINPATVKEAINLGRIPTDFIKWATGHSVVNESSLLKMAQMLNTVPGQVALSKFRDQRSSIERRLEDKRKK